MPVEQGGVLEQGGVRGWPACKGWASLLARQACLRAGLPEFFASVLFFSSFLRAPSSFRSPPPPPLPLPPPFLHPCVWSPLPPLLVYPLPLQHVCLLVDSCRLSPPTHFFFPTHPLPPAPTSPSRHLQPSPQHPLHTPLPPHHTCAAGKRYLAPRNVFLGALLGRGRGVVSKPHPFP